MIGIRDLPASAYHADTVADGPTLSASIAAKLVTQSPAHARAAHPRLNSDWRQIHDEKYDIGTAAHSLLLEGIEKVCVVEADSWRTNAAKEARDQARLDGLVPMLDGQWLEVKAMVDAAREQLAAVKIAPPLFTDGKPERTLVWQEDDVWFRCRVDWLRDDFTAVDDYKTASSANGEKWSRGPLYDHGCDIQCALYRRGVQALTGEVPAWRWAVQEKTPPYALRVIVPGSDVLMVGEAKVNKAIKLWRQCLRTGEWPGYPAVPFHAELPPWSTEAAVLLEDAA